MILTPYNASLSDRRRLIALLYEGKSADWAKAETYMLTAVLRERYSKSERAAFRFFFENAGWATPPGRAQCALELVRAERAAKDAGVVFVWERDDDAAWSWLEGCDERGRFLFPKSYREQAHTVQWCRAVLPCPEHGVDCEHAETLASLSSIFDADANCRRVVEAELAHEAGAALRITPTNN